MDTAVIYIHGQGGSASEAEHYRALFPDCDVIGFDYTAQTPWDAKDEFSQCFSSISRNYSSIYIVANSIGAFFTMNAAVNPKIKEAYFISPVVDMEKLIKDMMTWANVTEEELQNKKEIKTAFGETLSWKYLCYVRDNPVKWDVPSHILYGEKDHLTSFSAINAFAQHTGATIDTMPGGEHWFHTVEQMQYLDEWIIKHQKLKSIDLR